MCIWVCVCIQGGFGFGCCTFVYVVRARIALDITEPSELTPSTYGVLLGGANKKRCWRSEGQFISEGRRESGLFDKQMLVGKKTFREKLHLVAIVLVGLEAKWRNLGRLNRWEQCGGGPVWYWWPWLWMKVRVVCSLHWACHVFLNGAYLQFYVYL